MPGLLAPHVEHLKLKNPGPPHRGGPGEPRVTQLTRP